MIDPEHNLKQSWDAFVLLLTIIVAVEVPLRLVLSLEGRGAWILLDAIVVVSFALDVMVSFFTAQRDGRKRIADPRKVARRYLSTWFIPDVLASIPFTLLIPVLSISPTSTAAHVLLHLQLLRLLRLAHLVRFMSRLTRKALVNPAILRLLFFMFWLGLLAHWTACVWIAIGMGNSVETDPVRIYVRSLYYAVVTLTTVGYGDITPNTTAQTLFTIVIVICGAGSYGYIVGTVANMLTNIDLAKSHYQERMDRVSAFMNHHALPAELQVRIREYYDYLWESRRGYNEAEIVEDLPEKLKGDVFLFLNRDIIRKVPIFQHTEGEIVRRIALALRPVVVTPGDYVFRYGDAGHEMFFISRGRVQILGDDDQTVYATLSEGQFFGEVALLSNLPRNASARSLDFCDLYLLDRDNFEAVIEDFPAFARRMKELGERRKDGPRGTVV